MQRGVVPPEGVYNRDQAPIALPSAHSRTVDTIGNDVIWDSTTDYQEVKRFCTLNLTLVVKSLADGSNVAKKNPIE